MSIGANELVHMQPPPQQPSEALDLTRSNHDQTDAKSVLVELPKVLSDLFARVVPMARTCPACITNSDPHTIDDHCQVCANRLDRFDQNVWFGTDDHTRRTTFRLEELQTSFNNVVCRTCQLLLDVCAAGQSLAGGGCDGIDTIKVLSSAHFLLTGSLRGKVTTCKVVAYTDKNELVLKMPIITPFELHDAADMSSVESICDPIRRRLQECVEIHHTPVRCWLDAKKDAYIPKRVLDVRRGLVKLREKPKSDNYACLSHCWGANPLKNMLRTTRATYQSFTVVITWDSLPLTFKHAVTVCRTLGIPYLWIDALCIIQDDSADWEDQATEMASIYSRGLITIAASFASSCTEGLFSGAYKRPPSVALTNFPNAYARMCLEDEAFQDRPVVDPLITRAWTYQELQLSPRIAYFSGNEVHWRCNGLKLSSWHCNCTEAATRASTFLGTSRAPNRPRTWAKMIESYSKLNLTFESDRIPALAGIALRFSQAYETGRYLLGSWEDTLIFDLTWRRVGCFATDEVLAKREVTASWSWASVATAVDWDLDLKSIAIYSARVVDVNLRYRGSQFMGKTQEASITIEAPSIPVVLCHSGSLEKGNSFPAAPGVSLLFQTRTDSAQEAFCRRIQFVEFVSDRDPGATLKDLVCSMVILDAYTGGYRAVLLQERSKPQVYQRLGLVYVEIDEPVPVRTLDGLESAENDQDDNDWVRFEDLRQLADTLDIVQFNLV